MRRFHPVFFQRLPIAIQTIGRQSNFGAPQVRNVPAALLDQVRRRQATHRFIIHSDKAGLYAVNRPVNQYEGQFSNPQLIE